MKWYATAFATCVMACTITAVVELGRTGASDVSFTVLKWTGIGSATFAVWCVTIALGCGAPPCRSPE